MKLEEFEFRRVDGFDETNTEDESDEEDEEEDRECCARPGSDTAS